MLKISTIFVFAVLLAACQSNPVVPVTAQDIVSRDARLAALKPWRALGSLAVDSEQQGVVNASFTWDVNDNGFDIRLIGPLGLKTYRVTEDRLGAKLSGDGQQISGGSAEQLLFDVMGVRIPLVGMQDWVVGLQGDAINATRDRRGRLKKMRVGNDNETRWTVNFERYATVDDLDLPKRIAVSGDGVDIKMSIKRWSRPDVVDENRLVIPTAGLN